MIAAVPFLAFASALVVLAALLAFGVAKVESLWIVFPLSGMRISTMITLLCCFGLVLWLQRKSPLKAIYYAILAVLVPMGLFEILWFYSAAIFRGWDLRILQFAALFGWVLLGIREVYNKRPPKISILFYLAFIVSMIVWITTGFYFNDLGNPAFSWQAEALNVFSKATLFFGFAMHIGTVKP